MKLMFVHILSKSYCSSIKTNNKEQIKKRVTVTRMKPARPLRSSFQ